MRRQDPAARWMGAAILAVLGAVAAAAPLVAPGDPYRLTGPALTAPSWTHPFGTDDLGRDVFAGVVHGAATSLRVGAVGAAGALLLGVLVGGIAGMRGGWIDQALMRAADFVQAMPRFFLAITAVSLFGGGLSLIMLVIALTAWPGTARVFRSLVVSTRRREFVLASQAAGAPERWILRRHVVPLTISVAVAHASYQAGGAILAEAGLSFLGLGDPSVMSWGTQLGFAQQMVREAWWTSVFPGLAIALTVLGCNLLADSVGHRTDRPQPIP
ncbi:MAG TPA: ABC transporter permease [Vicinamibacterales bacterium]|nr:ABC transporter permease [Vicinamibacterales bacterium]